MSKKYDIVLIIIGIVFGYLIGENVSLNQKSYKDNYWNEVALTQYIADKYGLEISGWGGGRGERHNDTYMIKCEQIIKDNTAYRNCCEGEIKWTRPYVGFEWINKRCIK